MLMFAIAWFTPGQVDIFFKGVAFLISAGIFGGIIALIFKAGALVNTVGEVKKTIDSDIKPDLRTIRQDLNQGANTLADIKSKVDILWQDRTSVTNSPRVLNAKGNDILKHSGIQAIVDSRVDQLIESTKIQKPENAYQAEMLIIDAVADFKTDSELVKTIQQGAFNVGSTVDEVLFVGAIYVRDKILKSIGMLPEDIDKHKPAL